ncbi:MULTISPECIES: NYN domain-containing protein [Halomonadaceae]|nr:MULTISPECIES: NYN domain-containing protein [Halomonas]
MLDVMERAETAEVIVLTSGAGDFDLLVNKIRGQYGKQLTFMAPRR